MISLSWLRLVVLSVGIFLFSFSFSGVVRAQSLQEFLQSAYDYHPNLKLRMREALANYDSSYARVAGGFLPSVTYSYRHSYNRINPQRGSAYDPTLASINAAIPASATTGNSTLLAQRNDLLASRPLGQSYYDKSGTHALTFTQNLFRSFSDWFELDRFWDSVAMAKLDYYNNEQEFLFASIDAYLNVIRRGNIVDLRRSNYDALQNRFGVVERLYDVGDATETDLQQSVARLLTARAEWHDSQANYQSAVASFRQLSGMEPDLAELHLPDVPDNLPESQEVGESLVLRNNFEIRSADEAYSATRSVYRQQLSATGLRVDLRIDLQKSDSSRGLRGDSFVVPNPAGGTTLLDPLASETKQSSVATTLNFSLPLYNPSATSNIQQAYQTLLRAREFYTNQKLGAVQNFRAQWSEHQAAGKRLEYLSGAVEAAEKSVNNVIEQQKAGLRLIVDILDEQTGLVNAQVSNEEARYDYIISAFQILRRSGQLTASDLGLASVYAEQIDDYYSSQGYKGLFPGVVTTSAHLFK